MEIIYIFVCILACFIPAESTTSESNNTYCASEEKAKSLLDAAVQLINSAKESIPDKSTTTESTDNHCGSEGKGKTFLEAAVQLINSAKESIPRSTFEQKLPANATCNEMPHGSNDSSSKCHIEPMDCTELLQCGNTESGVYKVWPRNKIIEESVEVYCDMSTDQGGWTVIQRRGNYGRPYDYFFKGWEEYKNGFGDIERDFWLGNDLIFALTNQRMYSMRIDLQDVKAETRYALYDIFWIDSEDEQYKLHVQNYSGDANDALIREHNNQKFSTKDMDNDNYRGNCAEKYKGGWWYNACHISNLNGLYLPGKHESIVNERIIWHAWKGNKESLDTTEIKIRPKNFHNSSLDGTQN